MIKKLNYIFSTKDKIKIVLLTIIILIGSMLELLAISLFSPFIDGIVDQNAMMESTIMVYIYHFFSFKKYEYFLALLAVSIIAVYIIKNVYIIIEKNTIYKFAYRIQRTISTKLLKSYMEEPYTFHLNKNIAVLQRSIQISLPKPYCTSWKWQLKLVFVLYLVSICLLSVSPLRW